MIIYLYLYYIYRRAQDFIAAVVNGVFIDVGGAQ